MNGPENCIIDSEADGRAFRFFKGEEADSIVDGFTIINGDVLTFGAGILCVHTSPTIRNCYLKDNAGSGITCSNGSPTVESCRFENNAPAIQVLDNSDVFMDACELTSNLVGLFVDGLGTATAVNCSFSLNVNSVSSFGGGVRSLGNCNFESCVFENNTAFGGAGIYMKIGTVRDCMIRNNTASSTGGGIHITVGGNAQSINCEITGNTASEGGGVWSEANSSLVRCRVEHNVAVFSGGGVHLRGNGITMISGCTLVNNESGDNGGAIEVSSCCGASTLQVNNSIIAKNLSWGNGGGVNNDRLLGLNNATVAQNVAVGRGGGVATDDDGSTAIANSILWKNIATVGPQLATQDTSNLDVIYSDLEGGPTEVSGAGNVSFFSNIDSDPLFADMPAGDYHILQNSPCIDAGDPQFVPDEGETDIDGEPRVVGDAVDMGADEFHDCDGNGLPDVLELLEGSAADCNENNTIDSCDIDNGTSFDKNSNGVPDECDCPADLDGSGEVEAADLAELLSSWGPCGGCPADFDGDGDVDAANLAGLLSAWGPCE